MDAANPPLTFYPTCPMRILIFLVTAVGGLFPAAAAVTATRGGPALASRNYGPFPAINVDPGNATGDLSNTGSDRLATSTKGDGTAEVTYDRLTAPSSILAALLPGENILAIEVHQASATSSDMVCDAALTLTLAPPGSNDISIFAMENRLWLYWDEPSRIMETSPDLGPWVPQPGATSPYPLNIITPRGFFRVR